MTKPDILLVDWLGRGGIAHTTVEWHRELRALGRHPLVMTRGGRELSDLVPQARGVSSSLGAIAEHARLVGAIAKEIHARRPDWLVLAGSVTPELEVALLPSLLLSKTKLCLVVHEPSSPHQTPLSTTALRALWRAADVLLCHSHFVGEAIGRLEPRARPIYLAHPRTQCLIDEMRGKSSLLSPDGRLLSLTFGHLQKSYKGADVVSLVAEHAGPDWRFALIGSGDFEASARVERLKGFFSAGELAATVANADVVLLPYRRASQSGAVVLAQEVGTAVIASAVGGIPEQILSEDTGLLIEPEAPAHKWLAALNKLSDAQTRHRLTANARQHINDQHAAFVKGLKKLFDA